jgi:hypothetical protein
MNNSDNQPEDRDDLWELLGKAKQSAPAPLFSRNVLREIRQRQPEKAGVFSWWHKSWLPASVCTIAAVLLSVNAAHMFIHKPSAPLAVAPPTDATAEPGKANDTEVVAHLDELVAYEENSVWLEDSSQ